MASRVEWSSAGLQARLVDLANLPKSRAFTELRGKIRGVVIAGNRDMLLQGKDGRGQPMTPLRSKRKGPYKGKTGPPLIPSYEASRFIRNYKADWELVGGVWQLVMGWEGIVSKKGYHFAPAHILGLGRNPKRNPASIAPRTWADIRAQFKDFVPRLMRRTG